MNLTQSSKYSYINVSLEIFNYDPTKWGGIAEFGVIWEKSENLDIANIEPDELTIEYMDGSGVFQEVTSIADCEVGCIYESHPWHALMFYDEGYYEK